MRKLGVALAVAAIVAVASWTAIPQGDESLEVSAQSLVSATAALVDAQLGDLLFMMGILASTSDVQAGDWNGMQELLGRFELLPVPFNIWYLLPDGNYYKVDTGLTGSNLSDREYFPRVMAGETTVGDLVVSKSTGRKSMVMTVPIEHGGEVIGALGATVYLDDLSDLIFAEMALPEGLSLFAHTASGEITIHADSALLLESPSSTGVDLAASVSATSPLLGWVFVLGPVSN